MKLFNLMMLIFIFVGVNSNAAGFDCNKAEAPTEKLICSNAKLSALDLELTEKFNAALSNEEIRNELVKDQITWLSKVREKCKDEICLELIYAERIKYLVLQAGSHSSGQGFILTQSNQRPEEDLAKDAEIIVISGYEPEGAKADVVIDRPNSKVILVLSAYEPVFWNVNATLGTTIKAIVVGGSNKQQVFSNVKVPSYRTNIPHATEENNANFNRILVELNRLFATKRINYFNGNYKVPQMVNVKKINESDADRLSLDGPPVVAPINNFSFYLLNANNDSIEWSLTGPKNKSHQDYIAKGVAVSPNGKLIYKLQNSSLEVFEKSGAKVDSFKPSAELPKFSWETDVTYDSKRNLYSVISFGGEGYLYRFDPTKRIWLDANSAHNFDIGSISYDRKLDRYIGWAYFTSNGELVVFDGDGHYLFSKRVADKLDGYGRLYDKNNSGAAPLKVISNGNSVALVSIRGGMVTHIWNYDLISEKAILTYKAEVPSDAETSDFSSGPRVFRLNTN